MNNTNLTGVQLKMLVKESVKEVLVSEVMKLRALLLSYVSQKEQKEIERLYGKPSRGIVNTYSLEV